MILGVNTSFLSLLPLYVRCLKQKVNEVIALGLILNAARAFTYFMLDYTLVIVIIPFSLPKPSIASINCF